MAWTASITWDPRLDSFAYSDDSDEDDDDDDDDDTGVSARAGHNRNSLRSTHNSHSDKECLDSGKKPKSGGGGGGGGGIRDRVTLQQDTLDRTNLRSERPRAVTSTAQHHTSARTVSAELQSSTTLAVQGTTVKPPPTATAAPIPPSKQEGHAKEGKEASGLSSELSSSAKEQQAESDEEGGEDLIAAFANTVLRRARERVAWVHRIATPARRARNPAAKASQASISTPDKTGVEQGRSGPQHEAEEQPQQKAKEDEGERGSAARELASNERNAHGHDGGGDNTSGDSQGPDEDDSPLLQHVLQLEDVFATIEEERHKPPTWPLNKPEEDDGNAVQGRQNEFDATQGSSDRGEASSGDGKAQPTDLEGAQSLQPGTTNARGETGGELESAVREHLKRLQQQQAEVLARAQHRATACLKRHVLMWRCRQKHLPALALARERAAHAKQQRKQRSARCLQACILMWLARRRYFSALQAARQAHHRTLTQLQAHCRGFAVRTLFHDGLREALTRGNARYQQLQQRRTNAAATIQAAWRGHAWRSSHPEALQRIASGLDEWKANRQAAAVCIQSVFRMHLARRQYAPVVAARRSKAEERRMEEQRRQGERRAHAGGVIARVVLAYTTRRQHWPRVQQLRWDRAAARLQGLCRGRVARTAQQRKRAAIIKIQAVWRGHQLRQRLACAMQRVADFHARHGRKQGDAWMWAGTGRAAGVDDDIDDDDDIRALLNESLTGFVSGNVNQDLDLTTFEEELISGVQGKVPDERHQQQQRRRRWGEKGATQRWVRKEEEEEDGAGRSHREDGVDNEAETVDGRAHSAETASAAMQRTRGPREAVSAEVRRTCDGSRSVDDSQALLRSWTQEQVKRETRQLPPVRTAGTPPSTASSSHRRARPHHPSASAPVAGRGRGGGRGRGRRRRATAGSTASSTTVPAPLGSASKGSHWFKGPKQEPGRVTAQHVPQLRRARRAQMAKRMRAFDTALGSGAEQ